MPENEQDNTVWCAQECMLIYTTVIHCSPSKKMESEVETLQFMLILFSCR